MTRDLCCLRLATAAFDINVEPLKENEILLSQVSFEGIWLWLYFYMTVSP